MTEGRGFIPLPFFHHHHGSTIIAALIIAMIKPHQWILFAMNLAVDMWTEDYYEFLSQLDGEHE